MSREIQRRLRRMTQSQLLLQSGLMLLLWQRNELPAAPTVTNIAAGRYHSLMLKSDGSVWGMGANNSGQLGDGAPYSFLGTSTNQPEEIFSSGFAGISCAAYHSLFLKADGSLWATGDN